MRRANGLWLLLLCAAQQWSARAMMHDLTIDRDDRSLYKIEAFCFVAGGVMNVTVRDFALFTSAEDERAGFVMRRTVSESAAQQELEESLESDACMLDAPPGSKASERACRVRVG